MAQLVKNLPVMWETWVWDMSLGRSPGERKGHPLQYSGLENSVACTVHGIIKTGTWLSDFYFISPDQRDKSATIINIINNANSIPPSWVCVCVCVCVCVSCLVVSDSLWLHGLAYQAPLSMEFSRQEYWSGLPFPSPRHKSKGLQSGRWILGICMPGIS